VLQKIKIVFATLMCVFIVAFVVGIYHTYKQNQMAAAEIEIDQIVETLEVINQQTKPDFERENNQTFIDSVAKCVYYIYNTTTDVIPVNMELLIAQAALESGWGNSRFAIEGRNLFGIRTYDLTEPHMLPSNNPKKWGVKVYQHECDSVQNYIDILNNGSAFKEYRKLKHDQDVNDPFKLLITLGSYASDENYFPKVKSIIKKLRTQYTIPKE
tara:strand:- start:62 stop:700 length:639 start_codon:yes stop_codon:yes gene_type:complete